MAKQPTIATFEHLQAAVDEANAALGAAATRNASAAEYKALREAVSDARTVIAQKIATSPNPELARGLAKIVAEDRTRASRPASIGDRLQQAATERRDRSNAA